MRQNKFFHIIGQAVLLTGKAFDLIRIMSGSILGAVSMLFGYLSFMALWNMASSNSVTLNQTLDLFTSIAFTWLTLVLSLGFIRRKRFVIPIVEFGGSVIILMSLLNWVGLSGTKLLEPFTSFLFLAFVMYPIWRHRQFFKGSWYAPSATIAALLLIILFFIR